MTQKYEIVLSTYAKKDIENISDYIYYNLKAPLAAIHNIEGIHKAIRNLAKYPYRFSYCNDPDLAVRKIRERPFKRYIITYLIDEQDRRIIVLRVLHTLSNHREESYKGLQNEVNIFKE